MSVSDWCNNLKVDVLTPGLHALIVKQQRSNVPIFWDNQAYTGVLLYIAQGAVCEAHKA